MTRSEELEKEINDNPDKYMFEELSVLRAELKGRNDMRDEIREWISNYHNIYASYMVKDFDKKFGEKNEL